jgi:hypothetical protein
LGRPRKLTPQQSALARRLLEEGQPAQVIAQTFGVHSGTIYRLVESVSAQSADPTEETQAIPTVYADSLRLAEEGRADRGAAVSKPWVKPLTEPGYEYRQCYKANCRCMRGGAWHGPYRYHKQRRGEAVHSGYLGREVHSKKHSE